MIGDVVTEHVLCLVELECIEVRTLLFHDLLDFSDAICCYRYLRQIRFLQILPCTPCTSLHHCLLKPVLFFTCARVPVQFWINL